MRKLLMASAAILGSSGGLALAQKAVTPAAPNQGQLAAPYGAGPAANNNNNAWGIANTPTGSPAAGPLSGSIYSPNVDAVPAPGTIVIRLNGRVEVDATAIYSTVNTGLLANGKPSGYKLNPVNIGSYFRMYPAFDGVAANGLRYGASVEIRENFQGGAANGSSFANGLSGPGTTSGTATGPSTNSSFQTLFIRRAFTYLATDQAGLVRFGQGDGVLGLFDNCIFTTQCWDAGVGNFNGGPPNGGGTFAGNLAVPFVWLAQAGAEYGNTKVVYLSPQVYGFDLGLQYAPNEGNSFANGGAGVGCVQAGASCISVTSGNDATRWINQTGIGLRYQQAFGAVDFKAYGFYEAAGKEDLTTSPYATPAQARAGTLVGGVAASAQTERYDTLSFYKGGIAVTAFNVTYAADYIGGRVNSQLALAPTGGINENAVVTGLTYANGPVTAGAEVGVVNSQGDARLVGVSQRREFEIAFGGAYKVAPGLQLVGEYQYTQRHQGGFDFNTGTLGLDGTTRDVHGQGFLFGTVLTW